MANLFEYDRVLLPQQSKDNNDRYRKKHLPQRVQLEEELDTVGLLPLSSIQTLSKHLKKRSIEGMPVLHYSSRDVPKSRFSTRSQPKTFWK